MIHQTEAAKRRIPIATAGAAGQLIRQAFTHTFAENYTAATDIIEFGFLPADHQLASIHIINENIGAVDARFGFITGEFGNNLDLTRAVGDEIWAVVPLQHATRDVSFSKCLSIPRPAVNVGIGMHLASDIVRAKHKKITLVVDYFG